MYWPLHPTTYLRRQLVRTHARLSTATMFRQQKRQRLDNIPCVRMCQAHAFSVKTADEKDTQHTVHTACIQSPSLPLKLRLFLCLCRTVLSAFLSFSLSADVLHAHRNSPWREAPWPEGCGRRSSSAAGTGRTGLRRRSPSACSCSGRSSTGDFLPPVVFGRTRRVTITKIKKKKKYKNGTKTEIQAGRSMICLSLRSGFRPALPESGMVDWLLSAHVRPVGHETPVRVCGRGMDHGLQTTPPSAWSVSQNSTNTDARGLTSRTLDTTKELSSCARTHPLYRNNTGRTRTARRAPKPKD